MRIAAIGAQIRGDSRKSHSIADSTSMPDSLAIFVRFATHNPPD